MQNQKSIKLSGKFSVVDLFATEFVRMFING